MVKALLVSLLLFAGCSDVPLAERPSPIGESDGGGPLDVGASDSGAADSGTPDTVGSAPDASIVADAGVSADSAVSADTGIAADIGTDQMVNTDTTPLPDQMAPSVSFSGYVSAYWGLPAVNASIAALDQSQVAYTDTSGAFSFTVEADRTEFVKITHLPDRALITPLRAPVGGLALNAGDAFPMFRPALTDPAINNLITPLNVSGAHSLVIAQLYFLYPSASPLGWQTGPAYGGEQTQLTVADYDAVVRLEGAQWKSGDTISAGAPSGVFVAFVNVGSATDDATIEVTSPLPGHTCQVVFASNPVQVPIEADHVTFVRAYCYPPTVSFDPI